MSIDNLIAIAETQIQRLEWQIARTPAHADHSRLRESLEKARRDLATYTLLATRCE